MTTLTRRVVKLVVAAGLVALPGAHGGVEAADGFVGHWTRQADLAVVRAQHRAVGLADGRVLVAGGYRSAPGVYEATDTVEVVDPVANVTTPLPRMSAARAAFAAAALPDGRVLVAGGRTVDVPHASAELFDPLTRTWQRTADAPFLNAMHAAVMGNGDVLVVGTWDRSAAAVFNPAAERWTLVSLASSLTANANTVRSLVPLADGTVLALSTLGPTAVYNPLNNSWTATGSIESRTVAVEVRLLDGRVLVAGGSHGTTFRTSTSFFDPMRRTWSAGPALSHPHSGGVGGVLPDGTVVVAGGYRPSSGKTAAAEVLQGDDMAAGWQPAGSMSTARMDAAAAAVGTEVVVTGGVEAQYASAAVDSFVYGDRAAPSISGAPDRVPDVYVWYTKPVTVAFNCKDGESGVASCSGPSKLDREGRGQSATGVAVDRAGNTNSATVGPINIDVTPPETTIDAPVVAAVGSRVVTGQATDATSGVLNVRVQVWSTSPRRLMREVVVTPAQCTADDMACAWSTGIPDEIPSGVYEVVAQAMDYASHIDPSGASSRLVLLR